MIKTILVPATGSDADDAVFGAAHKFARQFSAHIDVLHVRMDPAEVAASLAAGDGGMLSPGIIDSIEAENKQREEKARRIFQNFVTREHLVEGAAGSSTQAVSATWHRKIGRQGDWIAEFGRTSDLVIVGRPGEGGGVLPETMEAALLNTGRPVLIPGPDVAVPGTIAIAWKSTREAARAVSAAMPFFAGAKKILILAAIEPGHADDHSAARLLDTLRRHHPTVELRRLRQEPRSAAETLLAEASEAGAGLLVMGGYGHSRLREWVFGGVTAHVLRGAGLSVLMAH